MFISEDEYLLAGTDAGYVSAKRVEGVWTISLPPKSVNDPRFADVEIRFAAVLADLEANTIPTEIVPVRGNIQNIASGVPTGVRRNRLLSNAGGF